MSDCVDISQTNSKAMPSYLTPHLSQLEREMYHGGAFAFTLYKLYTVSAYI